MKRPKKKSDGNNVPPIDKAVERFIQALARAQARRDHERTWQARFGPRKQKLTPPDEE